MSRLGETCAAPGPRRAANLAAAPWDLFRETVHSLTGPW